jgi:hypothetical protein
MVSGKTATAAIAILSTLLFASGIAAAPPPAQPADPTGTAMPTVAPNR